MLRIELRIGLDVIERAAGAPGPCAQDAPIVGLAQLAFRRDADHALAQPRAIVGLDAVGREKRDRPAIGDQLISAGGSPALSSGGKLNGGAAKG